VWPYRHTGAGRREFRRVVLESLARSARTELDRREADGQRLRARRALHRLEELEALLAEVDRYGAPVPRPWWARRSAEAASGLALLTALGGLAAAVVVYGPRGAVVGVADVAMLLATVGWFAIAVGRRTAEARRWRPSNEGSSAL
jgi:hypothetical protein